MKINIAIVEDEIEEKEKTKEMLEKFFLEENLPFEMFFFENGEDFLNTDLNKYNLLLLDIILPNDENGVEIAKKVREKNWNFPLMFITKTIQFALDGYKVEALDYLLKPILYEDFRLKLLKAIKIINTFSDKEIMIRTKEGVISLKESEIFYVEVNKHYLTFHTKKGLLTRRGTMESISQELSSRFANSSNSFLVNLDYLELIKGNEVLVHGDSLPLSRNYKKSFLHHLEERKG